jgi:integrase
VARQLHPQGLEAAVEAAKLDDFHFHDLRHTFASRYVMRGGSLPALQAILGHATLAMKYSHLSPTHLRDEMAKTDGQVRPPSSRSRMVHTWPGIVYADRSGIADLPG